MKTFITAIPLFDAGMSVAAYRLCDRNAEKLFGTMQDYQEMGGYLISPGLSTVNRTGVEPFTGGKPLFAELNQYLLLMGVPLNMNIPPELLVCILPHNIPQDEAVLTKCQALLDAGYTLALSSFPIDTPTCPLMELVQYVFLDTEAQDYNTKLKAMIPHLRNKRVILSNVPDAATFAQLSSLPNALFSGSFYSQPITKASGNISPLKINALNLLNMVGQEDFDLNEIAKIVERDPSISISLLRFINSPAVGVRQKISSIRSAVAILGQKEMKRWVTVAISISLAEDRPNEITKLSLVRAKFAENLATAYEMGMFAPSLFMAGLFSLLDVILEKPMADAITEISVDERVHQALVHKSGPIYEVMDLIYAYERANWDKTSINMIRNNVDVDTISEAFINALLWYKSLLEEIDDDSAPEREGKEDDKNKK